MVQREDEGLRQWQVLLEPEIDGMIKAYEADVEKEKELANAPSEYNSTLVCTSSPADIQPDGEPTEGTDGDGKKFEAKKIPTFTQEMKDIFRQLVENTQEQVDINKKMEEWSQPIQGQSSELNMRKFLYNRVGAAMQEVLRVV
jgi:hypothetical protein